MTNPFDQFDSAPTFPVGSDESQAREQQNQHINPFDQFDTTVSKTQPIQSDISLPQGNTSPNDSAFSRLAKGTLAQIEPYIVDRQPGLSTGQAAADVAKSGASGLAKGTAAMFTVPFDAGTHAPAALVNTGEYLRSKVTGQSPDYIDMPPSVTGAVFKALDYQPKTAEGQRINLISQFAAPETASAVVNNAARGAELTGNAISTINTGRKALTPEQLAQTAENMKGAASGVYDQMREAGAVFNPDKIESLRSAVNSALAKKDIIPSLTPVTSDAVAQINAAADTGKLSLNHLDQYRRLLRDASGEDSAAAGAVRNAIDSHVKTTTGEDLINGDPRAIALLNRGRAEYSRAAAFDDVGTVLQKANGDTTKIKNMLNTFLSKDENIYGLLPDEIASLRRASQTNSPEAMSKMLGKVGFTIIPTNASGNGVLPYVMMAGEFSGKTGAGALVPGGIPLVAAGTAAKAGNTLYARGLAQQALDKIARRELPPMPDMTPAEVSGLLEAPPPLPAKEVPPEGFSGHYYEPGNLNIPTEQYGPNQTPILAGEKNWRYNPYADSFSVGNSPNLNEQNRGGAIKKLRTGRIYAKPKSYSVLQGRSA